MVFGLKDVCSDSNQEVPGVGLFGPQDPRLTAQLRSHPQLYQRGVNWTSDMGFVKFIFVVESVVGLPPIFFIFVVAAVLIV